VLPHAIIAAAERRARSIGMGADRVLIWADAITEEAYLTALASWLGTSYETVDYISRDDCPLDDDQLIQAAAAGLLPLREGSDIVWIVAPRCLAARRLADPRQPPPAWLHSFRLTSSERLWRFVARHAQLALGRRAAQGLHRFQPHLSNAPRPRAWGGLAIATFVIVAIAILALVPLPTIKAFAALLCAVFLAAAALRLSSALCARRMPDRPVRIEDDKLPIYTVICALYREANVVGDLVAAIRGLDYPGIMAQTPQAT
jgi:glycosyltransferase XagB